MSGSIYKRLSNRYLRDIFEYFSKYVGSSALDSPAFMNLMPNIQMEFGLWYVAGGLYELARAFRRRLDETGVTVCLEQEVVRIEHAGNTVTGVLVRDSDGNSQTVPADYVVSNMEVIPAMQRLLRSPDSVMKKLVVSSPPAPASSSTLDWTAFIRSSRITTFSTPAICMHTFVASFARKCCPMIPPSMLSRRRAPIPRKRRPAATISRFCRTSPPSTHSHPYTREDYIALKELCLDKLERLGLTDLRQHIVVEDFWTPFDIEARYASNRGSIYGVVCDRRRNFAFKAPKQSTQFHNLFFVGGSVNPGGGMPMVTLSGQHVARMIVEQEGRAKT